MKKTPLYKEHIKLGAKMVEFAGFEMPVQYRGVVEEHHAVRKNAGLFDVSHMGEFEFSGPGASNFLNSLTANDVSRLTDGMAQYSLFCNEQGGIVDDILVYRIHAEKFMVVVNAANIEKDWKWIRTHEVQSRKYEVGNTKCEVRNISDETCLLAFQGPKAIPVLKELTGAPIENLKTFHFLFDRIAGESDCLIARTGYTGEDGIEIFCRSNQAQAIWNAILKDGAKEGVKPVGLGARDTLRLEARLSLYGHEINNETNPIEAGLGWVVKLNKENFIGKGPIQKMKEEGPKRQIVGFRMVDKGIPRQGYSICDGNKTIGYVTSGTFSPTLNIGIGLGYAPTTFNNIGTKFNIDIRSNLKLAEVVETPFYKRLG